MIKRLNSETIIPSADTIHNNIVTNFDKEIKYIKEEFKVYIVNYFYY